MNFELVPVQKDEKQILANLLEKYNYEFSQYDLRDVDKLGLYSYDWLDCYWTEPNRWAFFMKVDGKLAGFAMVNDYPEFAQLPAEYHMSEFFVMYKYRRLGIGKLAAFRLFDLFSGIWALRRHPHNIPSVHFWNKVVSEYTQGDYKLYESYKDAEYEDGTLGDAFHFSTKKATTDSTTAFSGKADVYAKARPTYAEAAIGYILSLTPADAVFADIGAGTGKLSGQLAMHGVTLFAIEPNEDMRAQLCSTLAPYPNAQVVRGSAEATTLPDHSVDVVTVAQALHWFDFAAFRRECQRILKPGGQVVTVYNINPGKGATSMEHFTSSTAAFYTSADTRQFPNPICYTREVYVAYRLSHSHDPKPGDEEYDAHIAKVNAQFDSESIDGSLYVDLTTAVTRGDFV
jgi:predicted acetyltransferase/ubiquinone/menaquinone biosynthesis C-methylase UbiE